MHERKPWQAAPTKGAVFEMLWKNSRNLLPGRLPGSRLPQNHRLPTLYRYLVDDAEEPDGQGELGRDKKMALVEAALFAADEPLTPKRLAAVANLEDGNEARRVAHKLQTLYDQDGSAFQIEELAGGFQLLTRPQFHPWLIRVRRTGSDLRLSPAARETLAIVAYRQPIMRADVEAIRGVQCSEVLRLLMEKGLVRIAGPSRFPGPPGPLWHNQEISAGLWLEDAARPTTRKG
jgi:segregation and condensation protein B